MSSLAHEYFMKEVIKTRRAAKQAIKEVTDMPAASVKAQMHKLNDMLHKSSHPITHMHLKKSINGGGSLKHPAASKAAAAILASPELKKLASKHENQCFQGDLFFKKNRDLARAFYNAPISGEVTREGKKLHFNGILTDTFDFRFDWLPKDLTVKGAALRLAGNVAYVAQEMGLLKSVKLTVTVSGYIK